MSSTSPPSCSHQNQQIFQVHFPPNTTFSLTSTMLQHDSPSMFSRVFLPSTSTTCTFSESASQSITIPDKSPDLFSLILDYLRGYTIFPLNEASIPPQWLPLSKTYENLKRDANYYGFLKLEVECTKWMKRYLGPEDRQAIFYLDFAPFTGKMDGQLSLMADMILECHLADVSLLRKRFLRSGAKNMTYGPMPWKSIFEQIRNPSDRDGVLQTDGSAYVDIAPVFLKPPRAVDDDCDERKVEYAKIHISQEVTHLIQITAVRPLSMSNFLTIRFHATNITTHLSFTASDPVRHTSLPYERDDRLIGEGEFVFNDKLQREGYMTLRSVAFAEKPDFIAPKEDEGKFPLDRTEKTVLEVDGKPVEWEILCEWSKPPAMTSPSTPTLENLRKAKFELRRVDMQICDRLFSKGRRPDQKCTTVSIHGSAVLTFATTRYCPFVVPQLIAVKGISESTWERKRPVWQGDCDREHLPRKRAKTKQDGSTVGIGDKDVDSVHGTEIGTKDVEMHEPPVVPNPIASNEGSGEIAGTQ